MRTKRLVNSFIFIVLILVNVGCDQVSKSIVRKNIDYYENITIVDNYITLTKVENTGAFLSLGYNLPSYLKSILLTVFPIIALAFGVIFLLTKTNMPKLLAVGISFLIGGGIGNIYDRLVYRSVTDFLHVDLGFFQTGIFNLADVSIMTGMSMILLNSYLRKRRIKRIHDHYETVE